MTRTFSRLEGFPDSGRGADRLDELPVPSTSVRVAERHTERVLETSEV